MILNHLLIILRREKNILTQKIFSLLTNFHNEENDSELKSSIHSAFNEIRLTSDFSTFFSFPVITTQLVC